MTTQHELIEHEGLAEVAPILREAALQIADPQVRYIGTVGGNVANGDPGNDMPGLMQCLDARFHLAGPDGTREVPARDFYEAAYMTARADDEILTAISFDAPAGRLRLREAEAQDRRLRHRRLRRARHHVGRQAAPRPPSP